MISADKRAATIDLFCHSPNRTNSVPDAKKALRVEGTFYVFDELGGLRYMSRDSSAFGAPATATKVETPFTPKLNPGRGHLWFFWIALSEDTLLAIRFMTESPLPESLPDFFESIESQIKSWVIFPTPSEFRWFHEKRPSC
jgi:hypothetical protein